MSSIKKFVNNEWKIFSATDAINISTRFPGYAPTTDITYNESTQYWWGYRSDKKLTSDISLMTAGVDYKVGDPIGDVYFKNEETGAREPYTIQKECILVNSHYSVHDVLAKHDDDIARLKRNVSWLALHGGGGGGSGSGSSSGSTNNCLIKVNGKTSPNSGYIVGALDNAISITLQDFTYQTNKSWNIKIVCQNNTVLETTVRQTQTESQLSISPSALSKFIKNNKIVDFIVYADFSDEDNGVYGSSQWKGSIVDPKISLSLRCSERINYNIINNNNPIIFTVTSGLINEENADGTTSPIEYNLDITFTDDITGAPYYSTKKFTLPSTGVYNLTYNSFSNFFDDIGYDKTGTDTAGSYTITAVVTITYASQTISSSQIEKKLVILADDPVVSIQSPSTTIKDATPFSSDSSINLKYIVYYDANTTFDVSYYIYNINDNNELGQIIEHPFGENKVFNSKSNELLNVNMIINQSWANGYVDTDKPLAVVLKIQYPSKDAIYKTAYFKITKSKSKYIKLSQSALDHQILEFVAKDYNAIDENDDNLIFNGSLIPNGKMSSTLNINKRNSKCNIFVTENSGQPYLRISNGCFGKIEKFTFTPDDKSKQPSSNYLSNNISDSSDDYVGAQNSGGLTISICYKCDYHSDDDHTILSCGKYDNESNNLTHGFSINSHEIYIGSDSIAKLVDSEINCVDITFGKYQNDDKSSYTYVAKVYLDGVLTSVTPIKFNNGEITDLAAMFNNEPIYIGGRPGTNKFLCDCNIYSLRIFNTVLSDIDIVSNYINNKIFTSYNKGDVNEDILPSELSKNMFKQNDDSTVSCLLIENGNYSISNLLDGNGLLSGTAVSNMGEYMKIPIVLLDVSAPLPGNKDGWTWAGYTTKYNDGVTALSQHTAAKMQYWDPNGNGQIINTGNITVSLQGTSTLSYRIKNIDITFPSNDIFIPKKEWLPEETYTIKVDMVDSSHSNNASIGRVINEVLGYNNSENGVVSEFFVADDQAVNAVYTTNKTISDKIYNYHTQQQPHATLKHTVEGFPIFFIMKFSNSTTDANGNKVTGTVTYPIGIASFNLGRKAYRNLGFKSLVYINSSDGLFPIAGDNETGTTYPCYKQNVTISELNMDCEWVETKTLHNNRGMSAITYKSNDYASIYQDDHGNDQPCRYDADFWQNDENITTKYTFESIYHYRDNNYKSDISKEFQEFASTISQLPIELPRNAITINKDRKIDYIKNGKYPKLTYNTTSNRIENKVDANGNQEYQSDNVDTTQYTVDNFKFDPSKMYDYFVIAMLFGLVDNFGKNISYRGWFTKDQENANTKKVKFYTDFYDLDTALGLSNNGIEDISPDVWFRYIDNIKDNDSEVGYATEFFSDEPIEIDSTSSQKLVSAYDNKLWNVIDTEFFTKMVYGDESSYSRYCDRWWALREKLDNYTKKYNQSNNTNYNSFIDLFVDEFFDKQTNSCGSMLFNYDYQIKYLEQNDPGDYTFHSNANITFLHGRRVSYIKHWLKERVLFLDSVMTWRDPSRLSNYSFKNNINNVIEFSSGATINSNIPITTNTSLLINGIVANNVNTFYWMKKNKETATHTRFTVSSDILVSYSNSSNIIKIGDDTTTKLSDYRIKQIKITDNANNLDAQGLPSLTNLNFSNDRMWAQNSFPIECFNRASVSELRTVNFSNSKPNNTYQLDFSDKFTKITDIDISNSKVSTLNMPDAPLLTLKVYGAANLNEFNLKNQKYLEEVSLSGCNALRYISIDNCYSYKKLIIESKPNLQKVIVRSCSNIERIEIRNCNNLSEVNIGDCKNLQVIKINRCSKLNNLSISNVGGLVELNLAYCTSLEAIKFNNLISGDTLRTFDINHTKISKIQGNINDGIQNINFVETYNNTVLLDLSKFPNLTYLGDSTRKDNLGVNVTNEYFDASYNEYVEQIKFSNDFNKPIHITKPFRSCYYLQRVYGHISLDQNPSVSTEASTRVVNGKISSASTTGVLEGIFAYCPEFSIHGNATKWNSKDISKSGVIKTSWQILAENAGKGNASDEDKEAFYDSVVSNPSLAFVNGDYVTNIRFSNAAGMFIRTFMHTNVSQFDVYYILMMIALSPCIASTCGELSETFTRTTKMVPGSTTMFNWATGNQFDKYTFYNCNGKFSGIYNAIATTATFYKSPDVGYYHGDVYSSSKTYAKDDIVSDGNGKYYVCKAETARNKPLTNTSTWQNLKSVNTSTPYKKSSIVIDTDSDNNTSLYICPTNNATFDATTWKKIEENSFYIARDNGLFSPLKSINKLDRMTSGNIIYSKWLLRRLEGSYTMTIWAPTTKLIVDIDKGQIFVDDDVKKGALGYYDFTDIRKYNSVVWNNTVLKSDQSTTLSDDSEYYYINNTGNLGGFFNDCSNLECVCYMNSATLNFSSIHLPKTLLSLGSNGSGWPTFCSTYARGSIDFEAMFDEGSALTGMYQCFQVSYNNNNYYLRNYDPKYRGYAAQIIKDTMFDHITNLVHYGYWSDSLSMDIMTGNGIYKELEADAVTNWDTFQKNVFRKITNIETLSNVFNGLRLTSQDTISFPGELFKQLPNLKSVHNFMKDCKQPYRLTSDGFSNCPNLKCVRNLCYFTSSMTYEEDVSSLRGEIPYRFFYHGFTYDTAKTYGSNNTKCPAVTNKSTLESFANNTLQIGAVQYSGTKTLKVDNTDSGYRLQLADTSNKYGSVNVINCCNIIVAIGDTKDYYYGTNGTIQIVNDQVCLTLSTDKNHEFVSNKQKYYYDITGGIEITIENACIQQTNNIIKVNRSIIDMRNCFYGCKKIEPYSYSTPVDNITGLNGNLLLEDDLEVSVKTDEGLVSTKVAKLETNPIYNSCKWVYNTNSNTWELNNGDASKQYCGYWSYTGDVENLYYIFENNIDMTMIADNSSAFKNNMFIESFDIASPVAAYNITTGHTNTLKYCCPPDLFRYTADASYTQISGIFEFCGYYGAIVASGMRGRICPYLLMPLTNIIDVSTMFRNCRRLSSYSVYKHSYTKVTSYSSDKQYYQYVDGLPKLIENPSTAIGDVYEYTGSYTNTKEIYQIPPTFFDYTPGIITMVGTFAGLILMPYTRLDVLSNLKNVTNISGIFSCCHFGTTDDDNDSYEISGLFVNMTGLNRASGCFSLLYLGFVADDDHKDCYCIKPKISDKTLYYATITPSTYKAVVRSIKNLKFKDNFPATASARNTASVWKYNWYGFTVDYTGDQSTFEISEANTEVNKNTTL